MLGWRPGGTASPSLAALWAAGWVQAGGCGSSRGTDPHAAPTLCPPEAGSSSLLSFPSPLYLFYLFFPMWATK